MATEHSHTLTRTSADSCRLQELTNPADCTPAGEEDTFVGTQRSWSTDYMTYDDKKAPRRCGIPRPVFRERAMYIDTAAMLGPSGFPMFNGDWDVRPQEVRSPDNCTRLCSETPGCQYTLFIRMGTRSR
jgi:hypothetical protein